MAPTNSFGRKAGAFGAALPAWLILIVVFGAAIFAARTIISYQEVANTEHNAGKIVIELESQLTGEQARNAVVINRGRVTDEEIQGFQSFRPKLTELYARMGQIKASDEIGPRLTSESEQYWAVIDAIAQLMRNGDLAGARALLVKDAAPIHEIRMDTLLSAKKTYGDQASAAEDHAAFATLMITVGGALCVGVLFLAASRQRTKAQLTNLSTRILEDSEARFRALFQNAASIITIVNADGRVEYQSETVQATLGYKPAELRDSNFAGIVHPEDALAFRTMMHSTLQRAGASETIEVRLSARNGVWVETELVAQNLTSDAHIRGVVLTAHDIRERKTLENQLARQALHDPLTGLPNRLLFRDRLAHALEGGNSPGRAHAVLFLDLDDFKLVNDSLGHLAGDNFLIAVSHRLTANVRSRDTVARFGGDEFAVLLENASDDELSEISNRLMAAFEEPFTIEGRQITATASLGIVSADGKMDSDDLLRDADTAMYIAKARGKGRAEVFTPAMHAAVVDRMDLEHDLREGILRGQFEVHYQPILGFDSDAIVGFEALLRWEHPKRGSLLPSSFISIAEENGLIVPLGDFALREACRQAAEWREVYGRDFLLSVNLSGRQLTDQDLVSKIEAALEGSGFPAHSLVLEITETVLAQSSPSLVQRLDDLRSLGLRLAIDDFGTGYSSLSYLQDFPVDILKIDRSFVDGLNGDKASAALQEAIVSLARALNLQTIAEGVERPEQVEQLKAIGCDLWQGFYFARPMDQAGIEKLMDRPVKRGRNEPRQPLKLAS